MRHNPKLCTLGLQKEEDLQARESNPARRVNFFVNSERQNYLNVIAEQDID
jgi:hypothetical protein